MMNVIVGILIGIVNDGWSVWFMAPFLWGFGWLIYLSIKRDRLETYVKNLEWKTLKWNMSSTQSFYLIE